MQPVPFSSELESEVVDLIVGRQLGQFGIDVDADRQPDLRSIPASCQATSGNPWVAVVYDPSHFRAADLFYEKHADRADPDELASGVATPT